MALENKNLRLHYTAAAVLFSVLIVGFLLFKGQDRVSLSQQTIEILKMISYVITFLGIPFAYGWYTGFAKPKAPANEEQAREDSGWKKRFYIFTVLAAINSVFFILTFNRSLMFVLIIVLAVFLLNKPKIQTPDSTILDED